jgi:hypothetical protein
MSEMFNEVPLELAKHLKYVLGEAIHLREYFENKNIEPHDALPIMCLLIADIMASNKKADNENYTREDIDTFINFYNIGIRSIKEQRGI